MAPQPTSPSFRISDGEGIYKEVTVEPRVDVNNLMTQLCNILQVEVGEEEDISSQSFGESMLRYLREKVGCWNEGIRSMEGFLHAHAQLRHSSGNAIVSQLQPENRYSNDCNTNSESSQIPPSRPNENNELLVELPQTDLEKMSVMSPQMSVASLPISSRHSPEVISIASTPQYIASSPYLSSSSPLCVILETFHAPAAAPTATTTAQNDHGKNISNDNSPPCMSPTSPSEGHQFSLSLEALGQTLSTNVTETGNWVVVDDTFVNELIEPPLPSSSSRQAGPAKSKAKRSNNSSKKQVHRRRVLKQKMHAAQDFRYGFYWCSCRSKFKSTVAQKHHIKFFNSEWKFNCDHCPRKFFDLTNLKLHLKRQHGMVNPLKEYAIGCTLCGIMFRTRTEFGKHKKIEHHINERPRRKKKSPRRPGMSSRIPGMSPRYPGMSQRRPWTTPRQGQSALSPQNSMPIVTQDSEIDLEQHQNNDMSTESVPIVSQAPNQYEVIDLTSDDEEEKQADLSSLPQHIDPNGIMNCNQSGSGNIVGESTTVGTNRYRERRPNYGKCYGCIACSKVFRHLKQLRRHLVERHQSKWKKIRCGICGMEFDSRTKFQKHRLQNHLVSNNEQEQGTDRPQPFTSGCPSTPPQMDRQEHHEDVMNDDLVESSNSVQDSSDLSEYDGP